MSQKKITTLKKNIIDIGKLLWDKDLAGGLNGNISARVDENTILLTAHGTCLGMLSESDILHMNIDGTMIDEGSVSTEKLMHTEIYKNYPDTQSVVHTHTTYTNAFFLENEKLVPRVFESRFYLGEVTAIPQVTPAVTDAKPIIDSLKKSNIAVLKNHGVVAVGDKHFDCFLLIEALEEAAKIDAISQIYSNSKSYVGDADLRPVNKSDKHSNKKYKMFSQEQMDRIVELVNSDNQLKELGAQTNMTMDLAVKLNETGEVYRFSFNKGNIDTVSKDADAEFVVSAPEGVWRSVFNSEIDPFVATTQKKMQLDGDFAKISQWYAPCSRVFELWTKVPIE